MIYKNGRFVEYRYLSFSSPFDSALSISLYRYVSALYTVVLGGTYVCINGNRFSTIAESKFYHSCGFSCIGMSAMPEVYLAREAGIAYAPFVHITDYDSWNGRSTVSVSEINSNLEYNSSVVKSLLPNLVRVVAKTKSLEYKDYLKE